MHDGIEEQEKNCVIMPPQHNCAKAAKVTRNQKGTYLYTKLCKKCFCDQRKENSTFKLQILMELKL